MDTVFLKNPDYLPIIGSFGGNQNWLKTADAHLARVGCGAVALADLALYRARQCSAECTDLTAPLAQVARITRQDYLRYLRDRKSVV